MVARRTWPDRVGCREVCGMIWHFKTWEDLQNTQSYPRFLDQTVFFRLLDSLWGGNLRTKFLLETIFRSLFLGVPKNTARVVVESEAKICIFDNRRFLKILVVNDHNLQVELWNCQRPSWLRRCLKSKFHSDLGIHRKCKSLGLLIKVGLSWIWYIFGRLTWNL